MLLSYNMLETAIAHQICEIYMAATKNLDGQEILVSTRCPLPPEHKKAELTGLEVRSNQRTSERAREKDPNTLRIHV